ncbi:MAG TPA: twin-arginine translocase TatA/TatE family subunit [Thermoplasmata archaeon]|nr:twin-arginine translocase TatA/TatE family subunit [Thermoplasmata archaeon]
MSALSFIDLTAQIEGIEWIILLVIVAALFLFGPSKLPELARGFGRAMGEFRRGRMEVEREITQQFSTEDPRMKLDRAANSLGVASAGKSELQVKLDIARAVDKAPDNQVVSAAQVLGVYDAAADPTRLRELVVKALNV